MKTTLVFFLLAWPLLLPAQDKWSIDIIAGPEYGNSRQNGELQGKNDSSGKWSYRFGFNYNHQLVSRLWLKTGLRMARIGYFGEQTTDLKWGTEFDHETGEYIRDPTLPHDIQSETDYYFLQLPLAGRWELGQSTIVPFVEVGVAPYLHLRTRVRNHTDLGRREFFNRDAPDLGLAGIVSFGLQAALGRKLDLLLQPVYRYHYTKKDNTAPPDHLYNLGMEIGLRFWPAR